MFQLPIRIYIYKLVLDSGVRDTGYLPFEFHGYGILVVLLPRIWNTVIYFRDIEFFYKKKFQKSEKKSKNSIIQSNKGAPTTEENLYIQTSIMYLTANKSFFFFFFFFFLPVCILCW